MQALSGGGVGGGGGRGVAPELGIDYVLHICQLITATYTLLLPITLLHQRSITPQTVPIRSRDQSGL